LYLRYIGLFLLTGIGGIASGFLWLVPNGLIDGALGMSLSAGTFWLGLKHAHEGAAPSDRYASGPTNGLTACVRLEQNRSLSIKQLAPEL
jgi:hypothetical protein